MISIDLKNKRNAYIIKSKKKLLLNLSEQDKKKMYEKYGTSPVKIYINE